MANTNSPRRRSPNGMDSAKPVPVRLTLQEREKLERVSDAEQRSLASIGRIAMRSWLAQYDSNGMRLSPNHAQDPV